MLQIIQLFSINVQIENNKELYQEMSKTLGLIFSYFKENWLIRKTKTLKYITYIINLHCAFIFVISLNLCFVLFCFFLSVDTNRYKGSMHFTMATINKERNFKETLFHALLSPKFASMLGS